MSLQTTRLGALEKSAIAELHPPPRIVEIQRWPIIRAFVPVKEVWRVSGCGSAGIIRQRPDGQFTSSFFMISLMYGGLETVFGIDTATIDELESHLANISELLPPMEPGPPQLAARFAWGA